MKGARFCHGCGSAAGTAAADVEPTTGGSSNSIPWVVASVAFLALTVLIALQSIGGGGSQSAGSTSLSGSSMRGPDISNMSPREITDNLFNRVMMLYERGLVDSARSIATLMAIPAFDLHTSLDMDLRYDLARIAEVTGILHIAQAQNDTMLAINPNHLLALGMASRMARARGEEGAAADADRRLLNAEKSELAEGREEYRLHRVDVDSAIARARRGGTS